MTSRCVRRGRWRDRRSYTEEGNHNHAYTHSHAHPRREKRSRANKTDSQVSTVKIVTGLNILHVIPFNLR